MGWNELKNGAGLDFNSQKSRGSARPVLTFIHSSRRHLDEVREELQFRSTMAREASPSASASSGSEAGFGDLMEVSVTRNSDRWWR
jgi:hypothetical protein